MSLSSRFTLYSPPPLRLAGPSRQLMGEGGDRTDSDSPLTDSVPSSPNVPAGSAPLPSSRAQYIDRDHCSPPSYDNIGDKRPPPSFPTRPARHESTTEGELLARLPRWISHWFGYRTSPVQSPAVYVVWFWSLLATFGGLCALQAVFEYSSYFEARGVPGIVASYGGTAVLIYGVIDSPLAQPRAVVGGHFVSALTGLSITKLFALMPNHAHFESVRWLAASLSCAVAVVFMQATGTTHPPAGATALLPATDDTVARLSWYYLPVVLLSSAIMLPVALIVNNLQRRYPLFWVMPPRGPTQHAHGMGHGLPPPVPGPAPWLQSCSCTQCRCARPEMGRMNADGMESGVE